MMMLFFNMNGQQTQSIESVHKRAGDDYFWYYMENNFRERP